MADGRCISQKIDDNRGLGYDKPQWIRSTITGFKILRCGVSVSVFRSQMKPKRFLKRVL